jgi:hypothetical protein
MYGFISFLDWRPDDIIRNCIKYCVILNTAKDLVGSR